MIFKSVQQVRRLYTEEKVIGCGNGRFVQTSVVAKGCEDVYLDSFRYFGVTCICVDGRPNVEPRAGLLGEKRGSLPGTIDPKAYRLYRSSPVLVNIQLNIEFEGVNREEAI